MIHALWIEWRTDFLQTAALLAFAGAKGIEADPHAEFDDLYGPPRPVRRTQQDREERMRIVAALAK
ncbi:hypothetical protein [Nonomuraea sp. SYSU D8015]|uniref:hypothetical protein n=1 Tax=Nonomuraea sp. SYSU D8015 TaxID=2593644 RepID=UPI0016616DAD|nr:hypothetical protein [Nonomuraea sp. SYSU D8015]